MPAASGRCGGSGRCPDRRARPPPRSSVPLSAQDTVDRLLRLHFRDGRTRVNADAQLLVAELLKVFVREAAARAARQAQAEDLKKVDTEHLEKALPQLLLDF
ncbi:hypothetical protein DV515_00013907 [Chloebia gouldiae]|uniref:Centromere protein X n=1 Tax=Chloebia gouldiae TaxID=44316 RepID=A0A3L8S0P6_CHLGU|nr:hypothetical protein DV515_00013907 [Chloebia gouldiae]